MNRTSWLQPSHDDWARPYDVVDEQRVPDIEPLGDGAIAPMGGLWSCVADLARWVAWFADAFPPRDDRDDGPLCRASRREMQQVQRSWPTTHTPARGEGDEATPVRIDGGGYGFGLFVTHDTRFGHFVAHSGGLPGYGSNMRWLPANGVGVVALGNTTYAPMSVMTRRVLEVLDEHGLVPATSVAASPALTRRRATVGRAVVGLDRFGGRRAVRRQRGARRSLRSPSPARAGADEDPRQSGRPRRDGGHADAWPGHDAARRRNGTAIRCRVVTAETTATFSCTSSSTGRDSADLALP